MLALCASTVLTVRLTGMLGFVIGHSRIA
jgi:hypothetical protein